MAEFRVLNFERGFTDNYVNGPRNAGQKYENLIISRNRKALSRDGSKLFDDVLSQIPTGEQRIQYIKNHEDVLFEFSGDEIFYREGTFKELIGPVDGFDAFGGLGSPLTSHNSTTQWQDHLYASIDTYSRARKIYKDEDGVWQIRSAGLPSPSDVRSLSTAITLANSLKPIYNAHVADLAEHLATDTSISAPNATDVDSLVTLVNEIKDRYIDHEADARIGTPIKHQATTSVDNSLAEEGDVVTLTQAVNLLNDIKLKYNAHDTDAVAHTTGSLHQEATADATGDFTVTPQGDDGKSYIYAIVYKYEYKIGTVKYIDRSTPNEISVTNAGDFVTNNNDLADIPELLNTSFGTQESWDTDNIVVEIYRSVDAGTILKKVAEISNGTTTYEDDTVDADLGIDIYTNGGVLGSDEPPLCKYLVQTNDVVWYANVKEDTEEKPFRLRHSVQLDPDSSPASFVVDFDDEITGISARGINPIVFTKEKTYRLEGIVDSLGRGFIKKRIIDETVGCISQNSIVPVNDGIYFAALDGFYFTNGFKALKISNHLNISYKMLVGGVEQQKRIYGSHDPQSERVFWAVQSDPTSIENDEIWVLDPHWGFPNGEGTFTTFNYEENGQPTAVEVIGGDLVRSDSRGYTFKHAEDLFEDPVIDTAATPSDWETKAVIYDYISSALAFGSELQRKWVTRLLTVLKAVTNISLQPGSINDDSGAVKDLKEIKTSGIFVWGDPFFTWGDPTFVWNAPSTITSIRRFPKKGIRCTLKQVRYTNSNTILLNSDSAGDVVVDGVANTITLVSGTWVEGLVNSGWIIDGQSEEFKIISQTPTVLTLSDPFDNLVSETQGSWTVKGFKKLERFHLESYTIDFLGFGDSHRAYRTGDDGSNAQ